MTFAGPLGRVALGMTFLAASFGVLDVVVVLAMGRSSTQPTNRTTIPVLTIDLSTFPVLVTERLVLRELRTSDAERVFAMRSDPAVMRHVNRPMATSITDAIELIERINTNIAANEAVHWALTRAGEDTFLGLIGFWRIVKEHHYAELGYTLMQEAWGQGYASEAIDTVVNFGFGTMGLHRVEAITRPANTVSMRVLEKNAFVREAFRRQDIFWNGVFHDSVHYGRLVTER